MNELELIRKNLKIIPNSFLLRECLSTKSKEWVNSTINKSLNEVDNKVYEFTDEYVRSYNLISFLYWSLGETVHAKEYNNKVLEIENNNIIAVANLIEFSIEEEDAYAIQIWNEKLLDIKKSSFLLLKGEAEIAYCYTRLGFKYYETALKKYTDILEKSNSEPIDKNLVMLWKYGIGLTLRRMSSLVSVHSEAQASLRKKRIKDAINVFVNLVKEENFKENNRIKAMAYTQLGELCFTVEKERLMRKEYFPQPFCNWKEEDFYQTGLHMCEGETYVLERYGKFLRYKKQYDDSEMMLRNSISIRETSFAHHHLALTLKSKLHRELSDRKRSYFRGAATSPDDTSVSYMRTYSEPHKRNLFPKYNPAFNAPEVLQTYSKDGNNTVNDTSQKSLSKITFNKVQEPVKGSYTKPYTNANSDWYLGHYQKPRSTNVNKTGSRQHLAITEKYGDHRRYFPKERSNEHMACNQAHGASFSQKSFNYDSGIDSMSSMFKSLSLGASTDDTGKQTHPIDSQSGLTLKQNTTSFRKSRDVGTPVLLSNLSNSQKSNSYKVNQTKAMIKSPKKLLSLPKDWRTEEIFDHLDKALHIENSAALYEKGLTLRAIGSLDEAIEIFKKLFSKETSLLYLANAYEQCGLCYKEKIEYLNGDEKKRMVFNMKDYFMKSVALSAKLVSEIPNIAEIWSSASSLEEIISKENPSKQNTRQLAVLHERLNNYNEAITYYKQLLKLEENVESAPEMLASIARNHMLDQDYISAATVFDMIRSHPHGDKCIDQNMYLNCLIEAGLHAVMTNVEMQLGRTYLRTALRHNDETDPTELHQHEADDKIEDESTFDIFILCSENDMTVYRMAAKVMSFLKRECDLSVTLNSADVMMGAPKLSETLGMIDNSETFIVFIGKTETTDNQYGLCVEHIITDKKKIVVIAEEEEIKAPAIIERFKHRINTIIYDKSVNEESVSVDWVKMLFQQLLHVH